MAARMSAAARRPLNWNLLTVNAMNARAFNRKRERKLLMPVGTVKFFNTQKGFGFIQPDDGSKDVFVHITAVERAGLKDLTEGQRITFEVEPDKKGKGPKAVNLVIA